MAAQVGSRTRDRTADIAKQGSADLGKVLVGRARATVLTHFAVLLDGSRGMAHTGLRLLAWHSATLNEPRAWK